MNDIHDDTLGLLKYDEVMEAYGGNCLCQGREIRISIDADEPDLFASRLASLKAILADIDNVVRKVQDYAIQELLPLKNEAWLDEDEAPVTEEEFRSRMTLTEISVDGDSTTFWHDDGDLFWGHCIQIEQAANGEFTGADIPG